MFCQINRGKFCIIFLYKNTWPSQKPRAFVLSAGRYCPAFADLSALGLFERDGDILAVYLSDLVVGVIAVLVDAGGADFGFD